jgi:hypothetical protein
MLHGPERYWAKWATLGYYIDPALTNEEYLAKKALTQKLCNYYQVTRLPITGWRRDQYFVRLQNQRVPIEASIHNIDRLIASGTIDRAAFRPVQGTAQQAPAQQPAQQASAPTTGGGPSAAPGPMDILAAGPSH